MGIIKGHPGRLLALMMIVFLALGAAPSEAIQPNSVSGDIEISEYPDPFGESFGGSPDIMVNTSHSVKQLNVWDDGELTRYAIFDGENGRIIDTGLSDENITIVALDGGGEKVGRAEISIERVGGWDYTGFAVGSVIIGALYFGAVAIGRRVEGLDE